MVCWLTATQTLIDDELRPAAEASLSSESEARAAEAALASLLHDVAGRAEALAAPQRRFVEVSKQSARSTNKNAPPQLKSAATV
eukprot:COSAG01_NODE_7056_length_3374_cov_1.996336_3_plen_84_part_00